MLSELTGRGHPPRYQPFFPTSIYHSPMLYTLTDIEAQFAPQTFAHGLQWFTDGRVTRPNIQGAGEIVTAIIPQVGDRPLRVYVRTFKEGGALTILWRMQLRYKG